MWGLDNIVKEMEERLFVINFQEDDSSQSESDLAEEVQDSD